MQCPSVIESRSKRTARMARKYKDNIRVVLRDIDHLSWLYNLIQQFHLHSGLTILSLYTQLIDPPFQVDHGDSSISSESMSPRVSKHSIWGSPATSRRCSPAVYPTWMPLMSAAKHQERPISVKDVICLSSRILTAHLSTIYGEKKHNAFEQLLLEVAARSIEIIALDWAGISSDLNGCLPEVIIPAVQCRCYTYNHPQDPTRHCHPAHKPEACQITLFITGKFTRRSVCSPYIHLLADARSVK
ncbi:hypothetical protein DFJ58DRAFT_242960 [Suillus subalutaceus]|uniref:uncharacterized protein n=1 Tax=Suillus subalutaceus TaxID=48586 RepID=UPI001B8664D4|nr:uncharacterized protein DFJ58DRAFT_242960 [Suillus subalutaceus]KAG1831951.1 hypothetical protein DFJ58DRAFT_242960 [Suillus subalutaceus]